MSPDIGDAAEAFFERGERRRYLLVVFAVFCGLIAWAYRAPFLAARRALLTAGCCPSPYGADVCGLRSDECARPNWDGIPLYPNQEIPDERHEKNFCPRSS